MTTVYVLTLATDYEGETLMGVYPTHQAAEAAGQAWLGEEEWRSLSDHEQFIVRSVEIGASADVHL